jgi:RHS repeat-associated protein
MRKRPGNHIPRVFLQYVVPLGFAGGLHDRDLGFVRFGWRDYDVRTGRWTAPDPIGEQGGDPRESGQPRACARISSRRAR